MERFLRESPPRAPRSSHRVPCGLSIAGWFLLLLEVTWLRGNHLYDNAQISLPFYLACVAAITIGTWMLHAVPAWGLFELGRRFIPRRKTAMLVGGAAVFGLLTQHTLTQGDGIGSHPQYAWIKAAFVAGFPLAFASYTWLLVRPSASPRQRLWLAGIGLIIGIEVNLLVHTSYQAFHGYLASWNALLVFALVHPFCHRRVARTTLWLSGIAILALAVVTLPRQQACRRFVQGYSHIPASLTTGLPLGSLLRVPADELIADHRGSTEERKQVFDAFIESRRSPRASHSRGQNILLIVAESVRADAWDDAETTPEFHQWKRHGVYVPRAVAQYPATALAYGAMFTSQPPSVLVRSPYWGKHRLFDGVRERFDHLFLSRPKESWFDRTVITRFFAHRDQPVHSHDSSPQGLSYLHEQLSRVDPGSTFFAWIHLYEPHLPYQPREPWAEGRGDHRSAYVSEVSYLDHHLGAFMRWFFVQPASEETLVLFVADHGEGLREELFGQTFWGHHVHVHDVLAHIPFFAAGPGLPQGAREEALGVMQLDIMPTIYDFLGERIPERLLPQGESLYELLRHRTPRPLITEAFSIRGPELFDFIADVQANDGLELRRDSFRRITTRGQRYSPKIGLQYGRRKLVRDRVLQQDWLYGPRSEGGLRPLERGESERARAMRTRLRRWGLLQAEIVRRLNAQ